MVKRLASAIVGLVVLAVVMISHNVYVFNLALVTICVIGIHEFYSAFKQKGFHPIFPLRIHHRCLCIFCQF